MKSDIRQPKIKVPALLDRTIIIKTNKSFASIIEYASVHLCNDLVDVEVVVSHKRCNIFSWFTGKVCVHIQIHGNPVSVAKACFRLEQLMVGLYKDQVKVSHQP